jgi:hypothetical protein
VANKIIAVRKKNSKKERKILEKKVKKQSWEKKQNGEVGASIRTVRQKTALEATFSVMFG